MSGQEKEVRARKYYYHMTLAQLALVALASVFIWYVYELANLPVDVDPVLYFGVHTALAAVLLGIAMNQKVARTTAVILLLGSLGFAARYLTAASGLESAVAPLCLYGVWLLNGPKKLMRELAPPAGIKLLGRRGKTPQGAQA